MASSCVRVLITFVVLPNQNGDSVSAKYILKIRSENILLGPGPKFRINTLQNCDEFSREIYSKTPILHTSTTRVKFEEAIAVLKGPRLQTLKKTSFIQLVSLPI